MKFSSYDLRGAYHNFRRARATLSPRRAKIFDPAAPPVARAGDGRYNYQSPIQETIWNRSLPRSLS
jgi:hypothetical protein